MRFTLTLSEQVVDDLALVVTCRSAGPPAPAAARFTLTLSQRVIDGLVLVIAVAQQARLCPGPRISPRQQLRGLASQRSGKKVALRAAVAQRARLCLAGQ
jgi:hypothetical protein